MILQMFEKNLNLVREKFPYLNISQNTNGNDSELFINVNLSKTGLPVAQVTRNNHRVFLNSSYDPELDARRWVEHNLDKAAGHYILCGAGFFYHVKALLESESIKKLVIYEPSPAIFEAAMHEIDLEPFLTPERVLLLTGLDYDEMVKGTLGFFNNGLIYTTTDIQFKTLTAYHELFGEEIAVFQEKLRQFLRLAQMNLSTTDAYAKQWLSNAFDTFHNAVNSPVIRHYFGQFKNVPAIVVSAGPSLEKNIHLVNEVKEKAVVICAGSSIRAMKRNGVSPHFLVGVDGHQINNTVYGDLDLSDVYLVYSFRFWHEVTSKFVGRKILMKVDAESLPDLFITGNGGYEIGSLKSGFSVSHTSLNLAFQLGCNPIILIGQDLAYSPTKRYADGQIASSQKYLKQGQLPPNSFFTKDIYGQDVLTDYELDSFRMLLERMIETSYQGQVNIINATEGGVHIKGTVDRKLAEIIGEYCRNNQRISERIELLYERGLGEIRNHRIDPLAYCCKLRIAINRAITKMIELLDELQALRKRNFDSEFDRAELDPTLERITNAYDQALYHKEYHVLLKDVQNSALSVNKARLKELGEIKNQLDYDQKLQIYLNIIADTKTTLEFVMECIDRVLNQSEQANPVQIAVTREHDYDVTAFEKQIKDGVDLSGIQRKLESALRNQNTAGRGAVLYLYGMLLQKIAQTSRAIDALEEAARIASTPEKAYFMLSRIYYRSQNYSKALECLERCHQLDFKAKHCRKMQLKINYQTRNWVAANNIAVEHAAEFSHQKLLLIVRTICCCHMELYLEARKLYQSLATDYKISSKTAKMLEDLLARTTTIQYEITYQGNREFFSDRLGLDLPEYETAKYKVCCFLSGEYVYDNSTGYMLAGVNHADGIDIRLSLQDCLAIYNTDNSKIFEYLAEALERNENSINMRSIREIPIYIIEEAIDNWYFLAQLFDFRRLQGWHNLHYFIAPAGGIDEAFMAEDIPWPNSFYGTDVHEFTESLFKIKSAKDKILQSHLQNLKEYYDNRISYPEKHSKILVVSSAREDVLRYYGQGLQTYLLETGFECCLHTENSLYQSFTVYDTAKLLDEFRPDRVIHLLGVQEELEIFKELKIPFTAWLLTEKQFGAELAPLYPNQRIWITGNLGVQNALINKGYQPEQIRKVNLPVFPTQPPAASADLIKRGIAIFADLDDLETIINDLGTVVQGFLFMKTHPSSASMIAAVFKAVYFQVYAQLNQEELHTMERVTYQKILAQNFQKRDIVLSEAEIGFLAGFAKTEFENLVFKLLQVKWITNEYKNHEVTIYGSGWERDPAYQAIWGGDLDFMTTPEPFINSVQSHTVNLWLGTRLKNKSYLQPDLIQGIAAGGFFLAGKWPAPDEAQSVLEPFSGLLESYESKAEMLKKVDYYLNHRDERLRRAQELQNYIGEHFSIEKIIREMSE
jgi:hypothetical protein